VDDGGRQILERALTGQPVGESSRRRPHPQGGLGRHARQPPRYALRAPLRGRRLTGPNTGPEPARNYTAGWSLGIRHHHAWERTAIVTDEDWIARAARMYAWMVPGELHVHPLAEDDQARAWLAGR
jgi:SpoIIAA-like